MVRRRVKPCSNSSREAYRVLKPSGKAILSDQLVHKALLSPEERDRVANRHGSDDLWHADDYQQALRDCGFRIERYEDWSADIAPHFAAVVERVDDKRADIAGDIDDTTIQHNYNIWSYWSRAGREGKIGWGYFVAVKDT